MTRTSEGCLTLIHPEIAMRGLKDAETAATAVEALGETWRGRLALWLMPSRVRKELKAVMYSARTYHRENAMRTAPAVLSYNAVCRAFDALQRSQVFID